MSINHTVSLVNRRVKVKPKRFVQGGINADTITVESDQEWTECDQILVTFHNESVMSPATVVYPRIGEALRVPKRMLEEVGTLRMSFTGYVNGEARLTTELQSDALASEVVQSGLIAGDILEPGGDDEDVGDIVADCLEAASEAREAAADAKDAAQLATDASDRVTRISTGDGPPVLGGKKGDLYIDSTTGELYELSTIE